MQTGQVSPSCSSLVRPPIILRTSWDPSATIFYFGGVLISILVLPTRISRSRDASVIPRRISRPLSQIKAPKTVVIPPNAKKLGGIISTGKHSTLRKEREIRSGYDLELESDDDNANSISSREPQPDLGVEQWRRRHSQPEEGWEDLGSSRL